jgi:hypothetical protein
MTRCGCEGWRTAGFGDGGLIHDVAVSGVGVEQGESFGILSELFQDVDVVEEGFGLLDVVRCDVLRFRIRMVATRSESCAETHLESR